MGQVAGVRVGDPLLEPGVVARVGGQQGCEGRDEAGQGRSSRDRLRGITSTHWPVAASMSTVA